MSMNSVFHPDTRKWISPLFNVGEEVQKLRHLTDKFMGPSRAVQNYEHEVCREGERKKLQEKQNKDFEAVKLRVFGPKKRGRPKKAAKVTEVPTSDESEEESDDDLSTEGDSEIEGQDNYSDEEEEESCNVFRGIADKSKKFQPSDEMYLFDSEASSEEEEAETEDGKENQTPTDRPQHENRNGPAVAGPSGAGVAVAAPVAEEAAQGAEGGGVPGATNPAPQVNRDTTEKDEKDFQRFYAYVERHAERVTRRSILDDRLEMIDMIMEIQNLTREEAEAEVDDLFEATNPQLAFSKSEVIVEDPMIKGSRMPLLAGPIPNEALQASGTLALYTGLSDEPGNFQWRMGHVMDILSSQMEGSLQLLRAEKLEAIDEKERLFGDWEAIITVSIYQPVDEIEDMLLEMKTIPEPEFGFEIEILSTQTVGHLCSMFACQADLVYTEDFRRPQDLPATSSEALAIFENKLAKTVNPWRGIFIHDTIYVNFDEKDGKMAENLKGIQLWAQRHKRDCGIGDIKFSNRMDTKLSELDIQLGYPYVYIHQGINCEHLFCFTSVRLPRVVENSAFPRYERIGKYPTKYCVVDNEVLARWAVVDCDRVPQNPMFLCTDCVKDYCYARKNKRKRVGKFKLYPFFQLIHHIEK